MRIFHSAALLLAAAAALAAAPLQYNIYLDTSSLSGQAGFIELQLNRGNTAPGAADDATATITGFTGAILGAQQPAVGDVVNSLAAIPLIIGNGASDPSGTNVDYEGITFGHFIHFLVTFGGPAVIGPTAGTTAGTTFSFGLVNSAQTAYLISTLGGPVMSAEIDTAGGITPSMDVGSDTIARFTATPEPSAMLLLAGGLAALAWRRKRA
jgi:hypothetical protein